MVLCFWFLCGFGVIGVERKEKERRGRERGRERKGQREGEGGEEERSERGKGVEE